MVLANTFVETICKNTIETILLCLENATKGTIYQIGPAPELRAVRITSGIRNSQTGDITWGLPEVSDYNPPGKEWGQYQDRPGRALEAMGWCVERQKSWTADNPFEDARSIRRQLFGEVEDYYHLEPVLISKGDYYGGRLTDVDSPLDWRGERIWQDTDFVVAAVIKIHFLPNSIRIHDRSTQIIKKLSRMLGTDLLSAHIRESALRAREELARERVDSCNVMAHELRNTLTKLGFVFSAVNAVMSFLREQWEIELERAFPMSMSKENILKRLGVLLHKGQDRCDGVKDLMRISDRLLTDQEELGALFLLPEQGEKWLQNKIRPKWDALLSTSEAWTPDAEEIRRLLDQLEKAISMVSDESLAQRVVSLPEELTAKWSRLAYTQFAAGNASLLDDVLVLLENPDLTIRHKQQLRKAIASLKILIDIISRVEERTNRMVSSLKTGTRNGIL